MILVPFRHYPFRFNGYNLSLNKRKAENGERRTENYNFIRFQISVLSFQFMKHPLCQCKGSKKKCRMQNAKNWQLITKKGWPLKIVNEWAIFKINKEPSAQHSKPMWATRLPKSSLKRATQNDFYFWRKYIWIGTPEKSQCSRRWFSKKRR